VALMRLAGSVPEARAPELYIVASGARAEREAPRMAEALRDALPGRGVQMNLGGGNFKTQFRRADRSGARLALILGDEELDRGVAAVKPLRREGGQTDCPLDLLAGRIASLLDQEPAGSGAAGDFGRA
jgi:histidyl-tRNA synthetase